MSDTDPNLKKMAERIAAALPSPPPSEPVTPTGRKRRGRSDADMAEMRKTARVIDRPETPETKKKLIEAMEALRALRPSPQFETSEILRVMACTECSILFAIPTSLHLHRTHAKLPLFCPAGHAHLYPPPDAKKLGIEGQYANLIGELRDLRLRAERAEARAQVLTPADGREVPEDEIKRRARALSNTARYASAPGGMYNGVICPLCGKRSSSPSDLCRHMLRYHRAALLQPVSLGN